ncbi:MAG: low temperature requirement protein A [Rhodothermales bacterium]
MNTKSFFVRPMPGRDKSESHRQATPLELFYDLVSVIAIAAAATELHHAIAENHVIDGVIKFTLAFFAIWWAWMNFTWFASAYDNDDAPYRIAVMVMMIGALVFAAGIPYFFTSGSIPFGIIGYVIMRLALVSLWLRAARHDPERRVTAYRYAIGITICQVLWVLGFFLMPTEGFIPFYLVMIVCELLVPAIAERAANTTWHKHHIVERYGLLVIIVLGESLLALSMAIQATSDINFLQADVLSWIGAGLMIVFAMWWLYFSETRHEALGAGSVGTGFLWGYGHFIIFASATAVGAGLAAGVDVITGHAEVGRMVAIAAVTLPTAIYVFGLWIVHERFNAEGWLQREILPVTAVLIGLSSFLEEGVLITAGLLVVSLTLKLKYQVRREAVEVG